jgi:hypothetical protein
LHSTLVPDTFLTFVALTIWTGSTGSFWNATCLPICNAVLCFMHSVHIGPAPSYLAAMLRFGPFARHRFFTAPSPTPSTALRNNSTLYRGIRLWNSLPSPVKTFRSRNLTAFKQEVVRFLVALDSASNTRRDQHHHHQLY